MDSFVGPSPSRRRVRMHALLQLTWWYGALSIAWLYILLGMWICIFLGLRYSVGAPELWCDVVENEMA